MQLAATAISKSFGSTKALQNVSIALEPGKVHALVGENGAGKSTLLKILAGSVSPDGGAMQIDGKAYAPRNLREAEQRGVAMVFQEIAINPLLSVAENIFIDRLRHFRRGLFIDTAALDKAAQAILDDFSADVSVKADITTLDLGKWKCIEIARALSYDPSMLFLDESTAFLNHKEVEVVLSAMKRLRDRGLAIGFVSHHLAEVRMVADTLTILKDGQWVGDFATSEITGDEIHNRMVGRDISGSIFPPKAQGTPSAPTLSMRDIALGQKLTLGQLDVGAGEIVGIAGLKGAGGESILEMIAGVVPPKAGAMQYLGKPHQPASPSDAWNVGIAYLPGDRAGEGLISEFSVLDNLIMAAPPRKGPLFDAPAARRIAGELMGRLKIKASSPDARCGSLSGGNLQKVLLGKCLSVNPRLLLLNNPTRGVDIGARHDIYRVVRQLAEQGLAIVLVSEDLPELIGMSDRIIVLRGGAVTYEFTPEEVVSEDQIIRHMA